MKSNICIVTGSRAEYGLLRPLIRKICNDADFVPHIVATGMHLSKEFGYTYREIENDSFYIEKKIEILQDNDSEEAISKAIGTGIIRFSEYFAAAKPDMVIILGDRFEIFAAAVAAAVGHIPISHLHGGETTEGADDEFFRHSITKMSYLHFTAAEQYRQRVIQMGEAPDRVFNVGAIGIENIKNLPILSRQELSAKINFNLNKPYCLVTFHPVTLEEGTAESQFSELLAAMDEMSGFNYIITKSNADTCGRAINRMIDSYCSGKQNVIAFTSMGILNYLSAMKYCKMVIGNSSSGIIEAPTFKKPTINIGDRQKGRILAKSVISCNPEKQDILSSMKKACSDEFNHDISNMESPFGDGNVSEKIMNTIKDFLENGRINLKKSFFDLR